MSGPAQYQRKDTLRGTKEVWRQRAVAQDLLLAVLASGQARFAPETHEFCFNGMRYSTSGRNWLRLVEIIGWAKLADAATAGGRRTP